MTAFSPPLFPGIGSMLQKQTTSPPGCRRLIDMNSPVCREAVIRGHPVSESGAAM